MYGLVDDIELLPAFLPWCVEAKVDDRGRRQARHAHRRAERHPPVVHYAQREPPGAADRHAARRRPVPPLRGLLALHAAAESACQIQFSMRYEFARRAIGAPPRVRFSTRSPTPWWTPSRGAPMRFMRVEVVYAVGKQATSSRSACRPVAPSSTRSALPASPRAIRWT